MCGIIGYTGNSSAVPYLIEGLGCLEYRGYDSAGISVEDEGKISTVRREGRLNKLVEAIPCSLSGTTGIGHTRWATHGTPSEQNAHPHESANGLFSVVHNGIIENYAELTAMLKKRGIHMSSQTDTEPVAHLLEQVYNGDTVKAMAKVMSMLEGSFALAVLCRDKPGEIVCARRANPLIVSVCEEGGFVASDVTAVLKYTKNVYKLRDGDIAKISKDAVEIFNSRCEEQERQPEKIEWSVEAAQKGGYEHFMLKEIYEQPEAIRATLFDYLHNNDISFESFSLSREEAAKIRRVYFVACGSAYHVGAAGKYIFEQAVGIPTEADIASEFRYRNPLIDGNCLVIIISQSGETADTLAALRLAKEKGARTVSVVNVVGSSIACESDGVIYTRAGPEIAVATTKAYSAQLSVVYLLAAYIGRLTGSMTDEEYISLVQALKKLPEKTEAVLESTAELISEISKLTAQHDDVFFIGRRLDYAGAMEASLKLKEISYIHSEALGAGELKHGTISLIDDGTPVVALCSCGDVFAKTMSNIREVKARKAYVICVTDKAHADKADGADCVITVEETHPLLSVSVQIIPMQLLSYYTAKLRGCDIDKPKNLAKSVTVE